MFDALSENDRRTRSRYHLTLGRLVDALAEASDSHQVVLDVQGGPARPHSYRGYYSDLAFEVGDVTTVAEFRAVCRSTVGSTFECYKGGEYVMGADTPLWVSSYGDDSGRAVVGVVLDEGLVTLVTRKVE